MESSENIATVTSGNPHLPPQGISVTPRKARVYVHTTCGTETNVDGPDFQKLANPYSLAVATVCCKCGVATLRAVSWTETGEPVADYRARLRGYIPMWVKLLPVVLPLILAAVGGIAGVAGAKGIDEGLVVAGVYAVMGFVFGLIVGFLLRPLIAEKAIGVPWAFID
jgi:hypothetical protein